MTRSSTNRKPKPPRRQIRAHYDDETVTVYQAYNARIAEAAVATQRLDAAAEFNKERMTWVKPSWSWMLYRAGYSHKDANQARILALRMRHEHFAELLSHASVNEPGLRGGAEAATAAQGEDGGAGDQKVLEEGRQRKVGRSSAVQVQWDPERTPKLGRLEHRSIQIGIRGAVGCKWVDEWIAGIEDVTDRARQLKRVIDAGGSDEEIQALCPTERAYAVPDELARRLKMDETDEG